METPESRKQWMEEELEQSLRRVTAPQDLWDRIHSSQQPRLRVRTRFMAWATVPVVMLVALWGSHPRSNGAIQFHSSDPAEIRAWVRTNADLDVPLHDGNLAGARIVAPHTVEIAYRAGGHDVSLLVSNTLTPDRRSGASISWMAGGQAYLLACAEPQYLKSCTLCHVGG